jgi:EAL domain-containing protein (putative c-di-GMP-specific phosphodiesterase class I)/CheY-like chemotaxis protein
MFATVGGIMRTQQAIEMIEPVFGRGKARPRACLADGKPHIRTFLAEALEELGFITCACAQIDALATILDTQPPDLFVLGLSAGGVEGAAMLTILAASAYEGKVLLLGPRDWPMVAAVRARGEELGLAMLPLLTTPFADGQLRASVVSLLRAEEEPPTVDVAQAVSAGWLELWYQPKLDARSLSVASAEAHVRLRHPTWGVVPPGHFMPDDGDPHVRALSEFVIGQAVDDWRDFLGQHGPLELAVNLPVDFLRDPESLRVLCRLMPDHPGFAGLIVELNGAEVLRNLAAMKDVAQKVRFHNIALSIDDLGAEWLSFTDIGMFPFVEIKVDRKFVAGCAENTLKQMVCRQIVDFADSVGARTVAAGVETRADLQCVREMGFKLVQGSLFAKPMPARKFTRTVLNRALAMPH